MHWLQGFWRRAKAVRTEALRLTQRSSVLEDESRNSKTRYSRLVIRNWQLNEIAVYGALLPLRHPPNTPSALPPQGSASVLQLHRQLQGMKSLMRGERLKAQHIAIRNVVGNRQQVVIERLRVFESEVLSAGKMRDRLRHIFLQLVPGQGSQLSSPLP